MADLFKIIVISPPEPFEGEAGLIAWMLNAGVDRFHVRHPQSDDATVGALLEAVPRELRGRISLHDSHNLAVEFGAGVHLNARNPMPPAGFDGCVSRSCHSLRELDDACGCSYVTLSPIFNSISKSGYTSPFTLQSLAVSPGVNSWVIALGGVTPDDFAALYAAGFGGAALLGYVWSDSDINSIKQRINVAVHNAHQLAFHN